MLCIDPTMAIEARVTTDPDILTAASSTLMSRFSKVDWFKAAVKMSEFFVGATTSRRY